MINYYCY